MNSESRRTLEVNVGDGERIASGVAGLLLLGLAAINRKPLGLVAGLAGAGLVFRGISGHCGCYSLTGRSTCARPHGKISVPGNRGVKLLEKIVVSKPVQEVFRTWRNFENLPRFMSHLDNVTVIDTQRSYWTARGPAGTHVAWEAEIINEKPDEMISWRSLPNSDVDHAGTVRFQTLPEGTEVSVTLEYDPKGGRLGAAIARLFHSDPKTEIAEDLVRFKNFVEAS